MGVVLQHSATGAAAAYAVLRAPNYVHDWLLLPSTSKQKTLYDPKDPRLDSERYIAAALHIIRYSQKEFHEEFYCVIADQLVGKGCLSNSIATGRPSPSVRSSLHNDV